MKLRGISMDTILPGQIVCVARQMGDNGNVVKENLVKVNACDNFGTYYTIVFGFG